jgi:hypothetical protein
MRFVIGLFILAYGFSSIAQIDSASIYGNTILASDLKKHLEIIASDEYEGRETGRKGQKMAAEYIANHFKSIGVPGGNNGEYYQEFPLIIQHSGGTDITINDKQYGFLDDFYFYKGFHDTSFTADEVVFVGYGIDDKRHDSYGHIDVKGKVVMVLAGEPFKKGKSIITKSKESSPWSMNWRMKMQVAKDKGAKAILIVPENIQQNVLTMIHYIESPSMMLDIGKEAPSKRLKNFYISPKMANEILKESGETIESLRKKITKKTIILNCKTSLSVEMHRETEYLSSENVLGFIEGTDKKEEIVILTAHYDHIGVDIKNNEVYNGADDDGSGTVAIMEIAEAFAKAKADGNGPRRSILIMPVAGEEKGLLGSEYYSENPVYPLANTVVDLNIDMIGRLDVKHADDPNYVYIIGSTMLSTELHEINETANRTYTKLDLDYEFNTIDDPNRYYYRSDHYNFAKNNVPVIFYFNGVHADYHKPTDTVDKINFDKIETITRLVFYTSWQLANKEKRSKVDVEQGKE